MINNFAYNLQVFDNQIFGDHLTSSWNLTDYITKVKESITYSLETAKTTVKNRLFRCKKYGAEKLIGLDILDRLFKHAGLKIKPDEDTAPLKPYEITKSEYQKIKALLCSIVLGRTNLVVDEQESLEFREAVFLDLILLFSRKTSRDLLLKILEQKAPVRISEGTRNEYDQDERCVHLDPKPLLECSFVAHTEEGQGFFFQIPRFVFLAHELIHCFHHTLYGDEKYEHMCAASSVYGKRMQNLDEQFTVLGLASGVVEDSEMNERQICQDFEIPARDVYQAADTAPDTSMLAVLESGTTPLYYAIVLGAHLDLLQYVENGGDINLDPNQQQLLYAALTSEYSYNKEEIVVLLIQNGAAFDWADNNGYTPLHYAVAMNSIKICEALFHADVDVHALTDDGETALMMAQRLGHTQCATFLNGWKYQNLEEKGADY